MRRWSNNEVLYLKNNSESNTITELSTKLNRSYKSVRSMRSDSMLFKLNGYPRSYNYADWNSKQ